MQQDKPLNFPTGLNQPLSHPPHQLMANEPPQSLSPNQIGPPFSCCGWAEIMVEGVANIISVMLHGVPSHAVHSNLSTGRQIGHCAGGADLAKRVDVVIVVVVGIRGPDNGVGQQGCQMQLHWRLPICNHLRLPAVDDANKVLFVVYADNDVSSSSTGKWALSPDPPPWL